VLTGQLADGTRVLGRVPARLLTDSRWTIGDSEALLIQALGTQHRANLMQMRFAQAERWEQVMAHEIDHYLSRLDLPQRPRQAESRRRSTLRSRVAESQTRASATCPTLTSGQRRQAAQRSLRVPAAYLWQCGCESQGNARGWLAFLVDLDDDEDEPELTYFCPTCSAREFGHLGSPHDTAGT
jgi:hypothetical protein